MTMPWPSPWPALLRFDDTFLLQGREADVRLLDDVAGAITDPFWREELLARRSLVTISSGGPRAVVQAAAAIPQRSRSGPLTAMVFHSMARLGRLDDVITLLGPDHASGAIPAPDEPWDQGALLYAAEASAEAAVVLRRAGQPQNAAAAQQEAARLLARCEGAATPASGS